MVPVDDGSRRIVPYSRLDAACVFLILLLCFGWFLPKTGDSDWVANSRAALVYAIVDQGVLHIDAYHEATGDKALSDVLVSRKLTLALGAVILSFFLYNSGYEFWTGGYSIGPRYLVPMLPFAMLPVAAGVDRVWRAASGRVLILVTCAASVANVWAQSIAGQYYPPLSVDGLPQTNPLLQHAIPHLRAGDIAINWGHHLSLTGWWTIVPLAAAVLAVLGVRRALHRSRFNTSATGGTPRSSTRTRFAPSRRP